MGRNNSTVSRTVFPYCIVASRKLLQVNEAAITQYHDPHLRQALRNNWGLLLYGLNSVQISTTCSKTKHKKSRIVRYLQAPWQCRVRRCPGLGTGRCPRELDDLHLVADDPAPESYILQSYSAAGFMIREHLSQVSYLHASTS